MAGFQLSINGRFWVSTEAILDAEDWSASNDDFKLVIAALRDDFPRAIELMRKVGANGGVDKADYRDWPAFQGLRKVPAFEDAFMEIFGEPLSIAAPTATPARAKLELVAKLADDEPNSIH